jgi:hypothetical protein
MASAIASAAADMDSAPDSEIPDEVAQEERTRAVARTADANGEDDGLVMMLSMRFALSRLC